MIKLSSVIPLPVRHRAPRVALRRTFAKMAIGESFDIAAADLARTTLYRLANDAGIKIAVSALRNPDKIVELYRVWRVE